MIRGRSGSAKTVHEVSQIDASWTVFVALCVCLAVTWGAGEAAANSLQSVMSKWSSVAGVL